MGAGNYMYAGTRAKTLERMLLSENQKELLMSAKSVDEVQKALYDTYLANFLSASNEHIFRALSFSIDDAKQTLNTIAPNKRVLDVLWIKYDFHNLKTILKGRSRGLSEEEILEHCYKTGLVKPTKLINLLDEDKLNIVNDHLAIAKRQAEESTSMIAIDRAMAEGYFHAVYDIAVETNEPFVKKYAVLLIDLYNIKAALRAKHVDGLELVDVYVKGGSFRKDQLESKEKILSLLSNFGGEKRWTAAIEHLQKTGHYNRIEKLADDYVTNWLKEESLGVFTPASLFSFFHARKNNAQIVQAITTAKQTGMPEKELRAILRALHAV
jgi:V/A-type H+-transporting ATPase subunit C